MAERFRCGGGRRELFYRPPMDNLMAVPVVRAPTSRPAPRSRCSTWGRPSGLGAAPLRRRARRALSDQHAGGADLAAGDGRDELEGRPMGQIGDLVPGETLRRFSHSVVVALPPSAALSSRCVDRSRARGRPVPTRHDCRGSHRCLSRVLARRSSATRIATFLGERVPARADQRSR